VIDIETKFKVIKKYKVRKSKTVVDFQTGISHSTIAFIPMNKSKMTNVKNLLHSECQRHICTAVFIVRLFPIATF
jgi:hypothetical protein